MPSLSAPNSTMNDLLPVLLLQMMQNQLNQQQHLPFPQAPVNTGTPRTQTAPPSASTSPRKVVLSHAVSLQEFATFYNISATDMEKLAKLDYEAGDCGVVKLKPEDWKEVGFTPLSWGRFLDKYNQFLNDVKNSQWN